MDKKIMTVSLLFAVLVVAGCVSNTGGNTVPSQQSTAASVKEFYTDSFFVMENGKPHPQYSLKEITVNKGDRIRVYVNTTSGTHDFNIDEFNVHASTPTGKVTPVEFVADKSGEFVYYCSLPGHRENGHWGTLKVL